MATTEAQTARIRPTAWAHLNLQPP